MPIMSNALRLANTMRRRTKSYVREIGEAVKQNARTVEKKAKQFSQRRFFSTKQLRQMGHPYAVRNPRPPIAPHIISRQSGKFHREWRMTHGKTKDGVFATVYNRAPYARYMRGTRFMIPRDILGEALRRTKAERDANVKRARRRGYYRLTGR